MPKLRPFLIFLGFMLALFQGDQGYKFWSYRSFSTFKKAIQKLRKKISDVGYLKNI